MVIRTSLSEWQKRISKELLYDLWISKNMSCPEVSKLLGIPQTSLRRLLDLYSLKKTQVQIKEMQTRILNESYAEHPERITKLKKTVKEVWNNYTQEQKDNILIPLKKACTNRDAEYIRKNTESTKRFYETESEEHKTDRIEKARKGTLKVQAEMSIKRKAEIQEKRTYSLRNRTPEQKAISKQRLLTTLKNKTPEEKLSSYVKGMNKRLENGSLFTSKIETEIRQYIQSLGFKTKKLITGYKENRFEIDIYIPEKQIGIEVNGAYYHSTNGINHIKKAYHYNKSLIAKEKGIEVIHIWEDQWLNKKDLIKTILLHRLGKNTTDRIYARNCKIKTVSKEDYKSFCENNHIQGYRSAQVLLGLYYQEKLVQIASFNRVRNIGKQNSKSEWEWVRGCPASLNQIVGGTSKLFSHFTKTYKPKSVLCYADWNLFNGQGYKQCRFIFDGYTGPDKFYVTPNTFVRINRNPYKYKEYNRLVKENKLFECYGAGSLRFAWTNPNNQ